MLNKRMFLTIKLEETMPGDEPRHEIDKVIFEFADWDFTPEQQEKVVLAARGAVKRAVWEMNIHATEKHRDSELLLKDF